MEAFAEHFMGWIVKRASRGGLVAFVSFLEAEEANVSLKKLS